MLKKEKNKFEDFNNPQKRICNFIYSFINNNFRTEGVYGFKSSYKEEVEITQFKSYYNVKRIYGVITPKRNFCDSDIKRVQALFQEWGHVNKNDCCIYCEEFEEYFEFYMMED